MSSLSLRIANKCLDLDCGASQIIRKEVRNDGEDCNPPMGNR